MVARPSTDGGDRGGAAPSAPDQLAVRAYESVIQALAAGHCDPRRDDASERHDMRALPPGLGLGSLTPVVALVMGCSGKVNGGSSALGSTGNATGPEVFTPAQVAAARALCNQPDGPVQTPETYGDLHRMTTSASFSRSGMVCRFSTPYPII